MDIIATILVGAILVESIVSAIKPIWDEQRRKLSWSIIASLVVGLFISFAANLDLAKAVGMDIEWPVVPQVITGVIISRGANYVFDFVERVKARRGDGME